MTPSDFPAIEASRPAGPIEMPLGKGRRLEYSAPNCFPGRLRIDVERKIGDALRDDGPVGTAARGDAGIAARPVWLGRGDPRFNWGRNRRIHVCADSS